MVISFKKLAVLLAALVGMVWGYTITLNKNYSGASANTTVETDEYGSIMDAPLPVPTRSGYSFDGWYSTSATTGARAIAGPTGTQFTENTTLYAKWQDLTTKSLEDIPASYKESFDWLKNTRHVREPVLFSRHNLIFDQIFGGEGTINYIVKWQSKTEVTLQQRQRIAAMINELINKWTRPLIGFEDWPYQEIPVTVKGWAVINEEYIKDKQPNEQVWTSQRNDSSFPDYPEPYGPTDISRFENFTKVNNGTYSYPGGLHARWDMHLWGTTGFGGGAGGDWGQRQADDNITSSATSVVSVNSSGQITGINTSGTAQIIVHEIGHGFGLYDFYGDVGTDKPTTTTQGCVFGSNNSSVNTCNDDHRTIMNAGNSSSITAYDEWMIRYYWNWVRNGTGGESRFKMPSSSSTFEISSSSAESSSSSETFEIYSSSSSENSTSIILSQIAQENVGTIQIFDLKGNIIAYGLPKNLPRGLYIVKSGKKVEKMVVK